MHVCGKMSNPIRDHPTLAVWTPKEFFPLLTRPQGSQGCQKIGQDPLNMPYEVWCANIAPKLKNIWKCLWKQGFFDDFSSILTVFCSLYNLRAILAQKENTFICRKKNVIFWHPWDPWGRINSGKNVFWVQTATVILWYFNFISEINIFDEINIPNLWIVSDSHCRNILAEKRMATKSSAHKKLKNKNPLKSMLDYLSNCVVVLGKTVIIHSSIFI